MRWTMVSNERSTIRSLISPCWDLGSAVNSEISASPDFVLGVRLSTPVAKLHPASRISSDFLVPAVCVASLFFVRRIGKWKNAPMTIGAFAVQVIGPVLDRFGAEAVGEAAVQELRSPAWAKRGPPAPAGRRKAMWPCGPGSSEGRRRFAAVGGGLGLVGADGAAIRGVRHARGSQWKKGCCSWSGWRRRGDHRRPRRSSGELSAGARRVPGEDIATFVRHGPYTVGCQPDRALGRATVRLESASAGSFNGPGVDRNQGTGAVHQPGRHPRQRAMFPAKAAAVAGSDLAGRVSRRRMRF